jgi:hypothetical protein
MKKRERGGANIGWESDWWEGEGSAVCKRFEKKS